LKLLPSTLTDEKSKKAKLSRPSAFQLLLAQQKTVFVAVAISILSHDVAARVDIIQIRRNGSRKIDGSKPAIAKQKAMIVAAAVNSAPYNVASRIDPKATERLGDSRDINCGKYSFAQKKTVEVTATVDVKPDDVASRVDSIRDGKNGSRHINLGKLRRLGQVTSCFHRR
jgi:hypothetical protein